MRLGGELIRRGDVVTVALGSANHGASPATAPSWTSPAATPGT
ncbi:hypothetical protein ACFQXA_06385 [Nocardiopsis composta]